MDNEMIERVSKAILETPNASDYNTLVAVNAIKAIREPTEKMKIAGSIDPGSGGPDENYETEVWQAMLDTIISNETYGSASNPIIENDL